MYMLHQLITQKNYIIFFLNYNRQFYFSILQQVNYKLHMNIRRMNDRKHHKRSKRGSSKV